METNTDKLPVRNRKIVMSNNRPALMLDGADTVPIVYALSDYPGAFSNTYQAQKNIKAFAKQGIELVACDTNLCNGWYKVMESEYEGQKAELSYVLDANPNAQILLRLHINPPYWWYRDHPEELRVYRTEEGDIPGRDNGESDRMIRGDKNMLTRVSTASKLWKKEMGERLRGFLRFLKGTKEGSALMAVQVAEGLNGEWHQIGTDVSPCMQRYFREEYLPEVYKTNENLRKAWNDPSVTFETAEFCPEMFYPADDGLFRDPQKSRKVMDAQKCIQKSNVDAIIYFCRIVKEEMGDEMLAGAFYAYYLYAGSPIGGHLMPEKVYEAKDVVNFLAGPMPYTVNRLPDYVPMQRGLMESNRLNGMLWLTEMDQRPEDVLNFPYGGDPAKIDTTIAIIRRNIFMTILAGEGSWFYDHREGPLSYSVYRKIGWWDNEIIMKDIGKMQEVITKYHNKPYKPVADVLFVYDTDKFYIMQDMCEKQYEVYASFIRAGVQADTIFLKDLEKCDINRYKLIVFPNAFLLTEKEREKILRLTEGKQVVWLETPAYCDGDTLSTEHVRSLLGMKVQKHAAGSGWTACERLGGKFIEDDMAKNIWRLVIEEENDIEALGFLEDGAVCAARKGNHWFFSSPMLTPETALPIVEAAGAYRYCKDEGISVLADNRMILLYTNNDGIKTVMLPNGKTVSQYLKAYTSLVLDAETGEMLM